MVRSAATVEEPCHRATAPSWNAFDGFPDVDALAEAKMVVGAMVIDEPALAFFNGLSGRLHVELTESAERVSPQLSNVVAPPAVRIESVSLRLRVLADGVFRNLAPDEWFRVVVRADRIKMRNSRVPETVCDFMRTDVVA